MRRLLLPLLLLGATAASAQVTRQVRATQLWPELQGELALRNGDYLLLTLRGERSTADQGSYHPSLGFNTRRARLAYEHFWSPSWSWGASAQLAGGATGQTAFIPEVLLRHRSPIFGGITFGQRLSLERNFSKGGGYPLGSGPDGQFWGRLRVDVEKLLPLSSDAAAGLALRPRLSYEASTHLRLQKSDTDPTERAIQYTSLRGEVGVRVSPRFDLTPWFAYQTDYQYYLEFRDSKGVLVSGGKTNLVYPTIGLDLRFTLLPAGSKTERQQLPTQH
jgi:hypothetical protein